MPKIEHRVTPFLWFNGQAEEAAKLYCSIFPNSRINSVVPYPEGSPAPAGTPMVITFDLDGQPFVALNGGPQYTFSPATSFSVLCENQDEIDNFWVKLTDGGKEVQCGWCEDKFGVTWQIVPYNIGELFGGDDPARANRVSMAMMPMVKLDMNALQAAYDGV